MRVERLLLRYSDGQSEWRTPADVPAIGAIVLRAGQEWIVSEIENDGEASPVAVLRRAPKTPRTSVGEVPEVVPST